MPPLWLRYAFGSSLNGWDWIMAFAGCFLGTCLSWILAYTLLPAIAGLIGAVMGVRELLRRRSR